jgi:hypothetical protein
MNSLQVGEFVDASIDETKQGEVFLGYMDDET